MISVFLASTGEAASGQASNPAAELIHRFGIEPAYLGMQFISFAVLALVLYKFAIKPVLASMDERQGKIEEGLKFADEIKAKLADAEKNAEATLAKATQEATAILKKAREDADARVSAASQEAIAKAAEIAKKAAEANELARVKMLTEVRAEVAKLVVATSAKVLSRELSADEKSRYAESAAREISVSR